MYQETEDFRLNDEIIKTIENLAKNLICASLSEIYCDECQQDEDMSPTSLKDCANCDLIRENVKNINCGHSIYYVHPMVPGAGGATKILSSGFSQDINRNSRREHLLSLVSLILTLFFQICMNS